MRVWKKIPNCWRCDFFNSAQTAATTGENALAYDECTSGRVEWQWDNSDPFGNNLPNENPNGAGAFNFNLRFPGQYFDRETNTHQNYFRDYDPSIGRYVQSDPIGLEGGINTFGYVGGNPLIYTDPTGQDILSELIKIKPVLAPIGYAVAGYKTACFLADLKIYYDKVETANGAWDVYNAAMDACNHGVSSACNNVQNLYDRAVRITAYAASQSVSLFPKK